MKKDIQTAAQKRPYTTPQQLMLVISHTQMLAASDVIPAVRTSSDKASTSHEALTKESSPNVWDADW